MEVEFKKKYLRELYEAGKATDKKRCFQPQVVSDYLKCVRVLQRVRRMEDLFLIKSLDYEKLKEGKRELFSLRINDQYRLEFREISNPDNILKIEICSLTDTTAITTHYIIYGKS